MTIAHRVETVIENDKILVLDAGKVVEYDTPLSLWTIQVVKAHGPHFPRLLWSQGNRSTQATAVTKLPTRIGKLTGSR